MEAVCFCDFRNPDGIMIDYCRGSQRFVTQCALTVHVEYHGFQAILAQRFGIQNFQKGAETYIW
ncbi:hypothetical protein D3C81_1218810 [compost metagenome]